MAINFYLGGTTGQTDGTLEVQNDGEGLHLPAEDTPYVVHIRAGGGMENAEIFTVPVPAGCTISKTIDGTYSTTVEFAIGEIGDTNVPIYFKRGSEAVAGSTGIATTPRLALVTEQAEPTAPAAFTPTVSNITTTGCRVTFSTTDVNGDSLTYKVSVTESATPPADWSGYSDVTSPHDVTGLTELTTYYAHVRAFDGTFATIGTSESFKTIAHTDSFTGASIDTSLWSAKLAANGTITTGSGALINVPAVTDGAILYRKTTINRAANKTYKWKTKWDGTVDNTNAFMLGIEDASAPFDPTPSTASPRHAASLNTDVSTSILGRLQVVIGNSTGLLLVVRGTNTTTNTLRFFDASTGTWVASGAVNPTISADTWYVMKFETNTSSQWKLSILSADESTVVLTTGWQDWSGITSFTNSAYLFIGGEVFTNVSTAKQLIAWYDEV